MRSCESELRRQLRQEKQVIFARVSEGHKVDATTDRHLLRLFKRQLMLTET
jgi:hypothetical protein